VAAHARPLYELPSLAVAYRSWQTVCTGEVSLVQWLSEFETVATNEKVGRSNFSERARFWEDMWAQGLRVFSGV